MGWKSREMSNVSRKKRVLSSRSLSCSSLSFGILAKTCFTWLLRPVLSFMPKISLNGALMVTTGAAMPVLTCIDESTLLSSIFSLQPAIKTVAVNKKKSLVCFIYTLS